MCFSYAQEFQRGTWSVVILRCQNGNAFFSNWFMSFTWTTSAYFEDLDLMWKFQILFLYYATDSRLGLCIQLPYSISCQVIPGNPFAYHSFIAHYSTFSLFLLLPFSSFSFFSLLPFLLPLEIFFFVLLSSQLWIHLNVMFAILQPQSSCTALGVPHTQCF